MWKLKKILLPTDGSPLAELAYETAIDIAENKNAELIGLYVHPITSLDKSALAESGLSPEEVSKTLKIYAEAYPRTVFKKLKVLAKNVKFREIVLEHPSPADGIVGVAVKEGADLIVMGTRGSSGTKKLIGSTAVSVINYAPCPVLVVREKEVPSITPAAWTIVP